jgi:hypothetical protein
MVRVEKGPRKMGKWPDDGYDGEQRVKREGKEGLLVVVGDSDEGRLQAMKGVRENGFDGINPYATRIQPPIYPFGISRKHGLRPLVSLFLSLFSFPALWSQREKSWWSAKPLCVPTRGLG